MGHLQINLSTILYHSGLSQARLARRTGLRPGTISDLVSGSAKRVEFSTLTRILDGLWDELGRPFSIEDLLHFESERLETQPDGTVIATDQYGLRWYVLEDGLYRPVPRTHL
ncbi:helix-turn-helix domain-containing protein [Deinococcus sp. PESE-13]